MWQKARKVVRGGKKGYLSPHLLDILHHHVTMPVKCLHSPQKLPVVPTIDQHLPARRGRNQCSDMAGRLNKKTGVVGPISSIMALKIDSFIEDTCCVRI